MAAPLLAGCSYFQTLDDYANYNYRSDIPRFPANASQNIPEPVQEAPQPIHPPTQQPQQDKYAQRKYYMRAATSPARSAPGQVNLRSEFFAGLIDESRFRPPELNPGDYYPTYDYFPGDRVIFFTCTMNNEGRQATMVLTAPNGSTILRRDYTLREDGQAVGSTFDVSRLMSAYGEGEYKSQWYYDGIHARTVLTNFRRN